MTVDFLFSGSSGNCTAIRDGDTVILIDCGKSARAVCRSLTDVGISPDSVGAIFITHEHSDHTSALEVFCSKRPVPVHITEASAERLFSSGKTIPNAVFHNEEYSVRVGSLTVTSFPLPHDSACHVGYVVRSDGGDTFGLATDVGHITERAVDELSSCRRVLVEANHDVEMLMEGRYPPILKRRILSPRGHLSNADCASLVCTLARRGVKAFALAHLSQENNLPDIAFAEVRRALDAEGFSGLPLEVTDREYPVRLPEYEVEAVKC